jgi:hypothetical protein
LSKAADAQFSAYIRKERPLFVRLSASVVMKLASATDMLK